MAPKPTKAEKKVAYDQKLCQLLYEYSQILIASADNVGPNQLQGIRKGLRGHSIFQIIRVAAIVAGAAVVGHLRRHQYCHRRWCASPLVGRI